MGGFDDFRVRDLMTTDVFFVEEGQSISLAEEAMRALRIRHIPVVAPDRRLLGIVTHRDLLAAKVSAFAPLSDDEKSSFELRFPVSSIMQRNVWSVGPETAVVNAAKLLRDHRFGCLPVVEEGKLVGIVSEADFLDLLTDSLDASASNSVLTVASAMSAPPYVLRETHTVGKARELMDQLDVRHLPVVNADDEPIGMISDRDVRVAEAVMGGPNAASEITIALVGTEEPYVVRRSDELGPVMLDMSARRMSSAMVVDPNGRIVGIITTTDACRIAGERIR